MSYTIKTNSGVITLEPLDAVLKSVTYDASKLTLWPQLPHCSCPSYPWNPNETDYRAPLFELIHKLLHTDPYV